MINADYASDMIKGLTEDSEKKLLSQLEFLVSRGLLVIKSAQPALVKNHLGGISIQQQIELTVPQEEYILALEEKVNKWKDAHSILLKELTRVLETKDD